MAPHDVPDPREIGCSTHRLREDGRNLSETVSTERSRGEVATRLGVNIAAIVEMVNGRTRNAECLARVHVAGGAVDRPGGDTFEPVHRLFEPVVAVWRRHPAPC